MNANRKCSHCGHNGHNLRTCPERGVKLFGVTLNKEESPQEQFQAGPEEVRKDAGLLRSGSALSLGRRQAMSPELSDQSGKETTSGSSLGRSPLGRSTASPAPPVCRLADRLAGETGHAGVAVGRGGEGAMGAWHGEEGREQEGRSEDLKSKARRMEVDAARLLQTDEKMPAEGDGYLSDNGGGPEVGASASKERKKGERPPTH